MAFNLMKDAVDYTKKKCQETDLICKFSTTCRQPFLAATRAAFSGQSGPYFAASF